jgi:hypothetical protein
LAAKIAWAAEKQWVTLTLMPSSVNLFVAFNPSLVRGHLTTTFDAVREYSRPSRSMPSRSRLVTSADTSLCTISQIIAIYYLKSTLPSLAINEEFVVTPLITPSSAASRISFRLAISIKISSLTSHYQN